MLYLINETPREGHKPQTKKFKKKMKKLFVTLMALVVATGAFAQIKVGVKAGGNIANISGMISEENGLDWGDLAKVTPSQSMKVGFNAGVWAEYKVMPLFGVQVELNYSTQGVNTKVETSSSLLGAASTTTTTYKANYINIPILAKFHFANIAAYVGPQLGFNVGFDTTTTTTTEDNTNIKEGAVEKYNGADFSVALGAQYKFTPNIGVDVRYNIGLTNTFPATTNDKGEVLTEAWGKQSVVQIGLFYEF